MLLILPHKHIMLILFSKFCYIFLIFLVSLKNLQILQENRFNAKLSFKNEKKTFLILLLLLQTALLLQPLRYSLPDLLIYYNK